MAITKSVLPFRRAETALEIADRKARLAPVTPSDPRTKVRAPEAYPEPPAQTVLDGYDSNGGHMELSRRAAILDAKRKFSRMRTIAPSAWQAAEQARFAVETESAMFHEVISTTTTAIGELEAALLGRADALAAADSDKAKHADAMEKLNDVSALELDAAEALRLDTARRFLPQRVSEYEQTAERHAADIARLVSEHKLDVDACITVLLNEARDENGRITNHQVVSRHNAGYMKPKD